jgi:hypothetical protein
MLPGMLVCGLAAGPLPGAESRIRLSDGLAQSPGPHLTYEDPRSLAAVINRQGPGSSTLLFGFQREAVRTGQMLDVRRDYTYPDGKLAARERALYEGNDLVLYELQESQIGARGSARIRRVPGNPAKGSIEFEYSKAPGTAPKTSTEALAQNTLIGDMVAPFLVSHWTELRRGEKLRCRYIVVPRRETVGFTFVEDSQATGQSQDVVIIRMEATSRFVAALVDPVFFTIEKASPHRILQYAGRTVPKIQAGGKWRDLDAVTVFDWKSAHSKTSRRDARPVSGKALDWFDRFANAGRARGGARSE